MQPLNQIQGPMAKRGNPYAIVRLEPEVMRLIQQRSEPPKRGRGGGVSQYLRQLVYEHLGLGEAPCFAEPKTEPKAPEIRASARRPEPVAPEFM
jgi:hypothetical protein